MVLDFGTATTFDVVNKTGAYIGGVIIPGPITSMATLSGKAKALDPTQSATVKNMRPPSVCHLDWRLLGPRRPLQGDER